MRPEDLRRRTRAFALQVLDFCDRLPGTPKIQEIAAQLRRAANGVASDYRAAGRGRSHAEFTAKIGTVVEEADESQHWLDMLTELGIDDETLPGCFENPVNSSPFSRPPTKPPRGASKSEQPTKGNPNPEANNSRPIGLSRARGEGPRANWPIARFPDLAIVPLPDSPIPDDHVPPLSSSSPFLPSAGLPETGVRRRIFGGFRPVFDVTHWKYMALRLRRHDVITPL